MSSSARLTSVSAAPKSLPTSIADLAGGAVPLAPPRSTAPRSRPAFRGSRGRSPRAAVGPRSMQICERLEVRAPRGPGTPSCRLDRVEEDQGAGRGCSRSPIARAPAAARSAQAFASFRRSCSTRMRAVRLSRRTMRGRPRRRRPVEEPPGPADDPHAPSRSSPGAGVDGRLARRAPRRGRPGRRAAAARRGGRRPRDSSNIPASSRSSPTAVHSSRAVGVGDVGHRRLTSRAVSKWSAASALAYERRASSPGHLGVAPGPCRVTRPREVQHQGGGVGVEVGADPLEHLARRRGGSWPGRGRPSPS